MRKVNKKEKLNDWKNILIHIEIIHTKHTDLHNICSYIFWCVCIFICLYTCIMWKNNNNNSQTDEIKKENPKTTTGKLKMTICFVVLLYFQP